MSPGVTSTRHGRLAPTCRKHTAVTRHLGASKPATAAPPSTCSSAGLAAARRSPRARPARSRAHQTTWASASARRASQSARACVLCPRLTPPQLQLPRQARPPTPRPHHSSVRAAMLRFVPRALGTSRFFLRSLSFFDDYCVRNLPGVTTMLFFCHARLLCLVTSFRLHHVLHRRHCWQRMGCASGMHEPATTGRP